MNLQENHKKFAQTCSEDCSCCLGLQVAKERYLAASRGQAERLVSGSDDNTLYMWQPASSKKHISRMTGHMQLVNQVRSEQSQCIAAQHRHVQTTNRMQVIIPAFSELVECPGVNPAAVGMQGCVKAYQYAILHVMLISTASAASTQINPMLLLMAVHLEHGTNSMTSLMHCRPVRTRIMHDQAQLHHRHASEWLVFGVAGLKCTATTKHNCKRHP